MSSATNNDEVNPYLAMREAKIARNHKRLRELGLLEPPQPPATTTPRTKRSRSKPKPLVHQSPVRRSTRLSSQVTPDYKDVVLPPEKHLVVGRKRPRSPVPELADSSFTSIEKRVASARAPQPCPPAANSVRTIDLDVKALVLGEDNDGVLGKMMEHGGKQFVINQSFSVAASVDDQQRLANTKLSFNKYCGVQDWKNAIFLWVNLGHADSPNEFLEGAKQVTWFGGSRMHDQSRIILKLLKFGEVSAMKENKEGGSNNIVLWCRRYQPDVKKFTPYVCFGRMGYRSHVPGSHPLSFVWNLLDYDGLKHHNDLAVRETFDLFTK